LAAHLGSAFTRDVFSSHQEAVFRSRRAEEEMRAHFRALRDKVEAQAAPRAKAGNGRQATTGPLLFQLGSSIHRPSFVHDTQAQAVALPGQRGNSPVTSVFSSSASAASEGNISVTLSHVAPDGLPLTSPVRTAGGAVLHQLTGSPQLDRELVSESDMELARRAARDASLNQRGSPVQPVRSSSPAGFGPSRSPLKPPAFLARAGRHNDDDENPLSPNAREPRSAEDNTFAAAPSGRSTSPKSEWAQRPKPSATGHGYLPVEFAPASLLSSPSSDAATGHGYGSVAALPRYYASSHWQPPAPASITDEQLRANVAVAAAMRADAQREREINQLAQWRRIEQEKEHYRQRVLQQHE
jgi:hypothetical protein